MIIGDGPDRERLEALARDLDVTGAVRFAGYLSGACLMSHLSAVTIGVIPDPPDEFNDKLSMNKVFEYMMLGLPFVQFNLRQATREAAGAALIVRDHSPSALADGILELIDDPDRRKAMATAGREIAEREFQWSGEARKYLGVYDELFRPRLEIE